MIEIATNTTLGKTKLLFSPFDKGNNVTKAMQMGNTLNG